MALRIRDFRFQPCNARWLLYVPNDVTFEHAELCSRLVSCLTVNATCILIGTL